MNKKNILKVTLIFGGGFLAFLLLKPSISGGKKSLDGLTPQPKEDKKREISEQEFQNAEIVANAYTDALKNNEPPEALTELNKELMKEFNMRCYLDKSNSIVVCDSKGTTILTK